MANYFEDKKRTEDAKRAQRFWGVAMFIHKLNNVKALMKRMVKKDSIEYEMENLRFSMLSFEKHAHMLKKKFYELESRLKETGRMNYVICPKCGGISHHDKATE